MGVGCRALGDAFGNHRLRRADPRLRLPLAIDPRPRGRPDQRRGARADRHRAQSRPLRIVGLGPVARQDLLVAVDVHHAGAGLPQRPPHLRRGQRAGEIRRHRPVRDRRPDDRRPAPPHRPELSHAAHRRPLDLAAGSLRAEPGGRWQPAPDRHRRRHHRAEEPRRKDHGSRPAAARRDRDHPGSLRAVGRGRLPRALQLALPAPAQAAGLGGDARHLLRDRDRGRQHAGGTHQAAGSRRACAGCAHVRGAARRRQLAAYQRTPHQGRRLRLGRHRHYPHQGTRAEADRERRPPARQRARPQAFAGGSLPTSPRNIRRRRTAPRKPTRPSRSSSPI